MMKKNILLSFGLLLSFIFSGTLIAQTLAVEVALQYVSDDTFKLIFSNNITITEAQNIANYTISGTGGLSGNPISAVANDQDVTLQLPTNILGLAANESISINVANVTSVTGITLNPEKSVAKYFVWHFFEDMNNTGLEDNSDYPSAQYTGNNNVVWDYGKGRRDLPKDNGDGIMLRFKTTGFLRSNNLSDGIGSLSFNYYKVYSNDDHSSFKLTIDNDFEETVSNIVVIGNPSTKEVFNQENLNKIGVEKKTTLRIENTTPSNQNIMIDNIRWTSYAPPHLKEVKLLSTTDIQVAFDQILEENSALPSNFITKIGGTTVSVTNAKIIAGNLVRLTVDGDFSSANNGDLISVTASGVKNFFNGLESSSEEVSLEFIKPTVLPELKTTGFTSVVLTFSAAVNPTDAQNINNYTLSGTGGTTGNPTTAVLQNATTVLLTVPSTETYSDGQTLIVTVGNIKAIDNIAAIVAPNNSASAIIDRTAPTVVSPLEIIDTKTFRLNFSEAVNASTTIADYTIGGTAGITGNPLAIEAASDNTSVIITTNDILSFLTTNGATITVSVAMATDISGNMIDTSANIATYSIDTTKPMLSNTSSEILHRSIELGFTANKSGTIFWSILEGNTTEVPSAQEIKNRIGVENGSVPLPNGSTETTILADQLVWKTEYTIFSVLQSPEGIFSEVITTEFTTLGDAVSFTDEQLYNYKICAVSVRGKKLVIERNQIPEDDVTLKIAIYNLSGTIIHQSSFNGLTTTLSNDLSTGIYIVIIQGNGKPQISKVFIL